MSDLERLIRTVPDFPTKGIQFRDITPLLADASAFGEATELMTAPWRGRGVTVVCAVESRGFIFGGVIAHHLGAALVPIRKAGKLPYATQRLEYTLEYSSDALEIHTDAIKQGQRVLLIDDVLATGGTASAAAGLVEMLGGIVTGIQVLIELAGLKGRKLLEGREVRSLITYEGD